MDEAGDFWQEVDPLDYVIEPDSPGRPMLEEGANPFEFGPEVDETSYSQNDDSEGNLQFGSKSKEIEFSRSSVSGLNECLTDGARRLCLFDLALKLTECNHYDIGGTYLVYNSQIRPELWFYCTTSIGPQSNFILNIFFCFRKGAFASIGISDANTIKMKKMYSGDAVSTYLTLPETLSWKTFKSCEKEESHHLKSYCFSKSDLKILYKQVLSIPIKIDVNTHDMRIIDTETLLRIKRNHNLSCLFKRQENTDFTLQSKSGTEFKVHQLLLAAASSVLRCKMKNSNSSSLLLNIEDGTMEEFIEYIYTGSINKIMEHNWCQLIEVAVQFKLDKLLKKIETAIIQQICIDNAISIALISEKYKMDKILKKAFEFIRNEPKVLDSDGWKNLDDVELTKKLIKELYSGECTD